MENRMSVTDRIAGLNGSAAFKVPCRVATTANITLSGLQAIDGVTVAAGDRVLVKDQTDGSENGIYVAGSGTWARATDFNGARDVVSGTQIFVGFGTTNGQTTFAILTADDITVGTTSISFGAVQGSASATHKEFESRAAVVAASIDPATNVIRTAGYTARGDGGSALYVRVVSEPSHDFKITSADGAFWEGVVEGNEVWPEQFSAARDGTADDTTALNNAGAYCAAKGCVLGLRGGTYRADSTVTFPANVSVRGAGMDKTIIDGSQTTNASLTDRLNVTTAAATYTALPALSTAVSKGDTDLVFASAPSVVAGDVIVIYNDTDASFSGFRTAYRAGEQLIVQSISGSTVTVEGSIFDDYAIADVDLYKLTGTTTAKFSDFTIKGLADASNAITGFRLKTGLHCVVENVKAYNSSLAGMSVENCVGVEIINCVAKDDFAQTSGTDYGLAISNSREINVRGGHYVAASHGITIGGGGSTGDVPNRFFSVSDAYVSSDAVQAGDCHGNSEYGSFTNCTFDGGLKVSGNHIRVVNNQIIGKHYNGPMALVFSEMLGCNFTIEGNTIESGQAVASRGNLIDVGGNSTTVLTSDTTRGGILAIRGNKLIYTGTDAQGCLIDVSLRGYAGSEPVTIDISDNISEAPNEVFPHSSGVLINNLAQVRMVSGSEIEAVYFRGNRGVGGFRARNDLAAGQTLAKFIDVSGNTLKNGLDFRAFDAGQQMIFRNNNLTDMAFYCGYSGDATTRAKATFVDGNVLTRCGWSRDTILASLILWNAGDAWAHGNFITGDPQYVRVDTGVGITGTFTVGETITGGTSGATATVYEVNASEFIAVNDTITGTFSNAETITGATSGATATLHASAAVADQRTRSFYFDTITELWNGQNIDAAGLAATKTSVTTDTSI
jgi:hypothetical protein